MSVDMVDTPKLGIAKTPVPMRVVAPYSLPGKLYKIVEVIWLFVGRVRDWS